MAPSDQPVHPDRPNRQPRSGSRPERGWPAVPGGRSAGLFGPGGILGGAGKADRANGTGNAARANGTSKANTTSNANGTGKAGRANGSGRDASGANRSGRAGGAVPVGRNPLRGGTPRDPGGVPKGGRSRFGVDEDPRQEPRQDPRRAPRQPSPRKPKRARPGRDDLPPWREALRRKAADRKPPPWLATEPRPVPRGAGDRRGAASSRTSAPIPKIRRASTGPRRLTRKPTGNHHVRVVSVRFLLIAALVAAGVKLIQVQGFEAEALAAKAAQQRTTEIDIPATRGSIVDRNGVQLAFSVESRMLAFRPKAVREDIAAYNSEHPGETLSFDDRTAEIARVIHEKVGDRANEQDLVEKLRRDSTFVYLVDKVEPAVARDLQELFPEIITEYRAAREYPGRSLASNLVGIANWRTDDPDPKRHNLHGLSGLESLRDKELSGTPGRQVVDTQEGSQSVVIPGTERDLVPATDGSDIELTIDADLQYHLQQSLADYAVTSGARNASAVVLDAHTGEVYAMANDKSFDPTDPEGLDLETMGNRAVSTPYEPGSVNKIVTALCTIKEDLSEPGDVHTVPDSINVADRTVHDAWDHETMPFTTTGIFAKSSNVGTLMLAEQCGPDRFSRLLRDLGLGQRTGVGLPGESPGRVPPRGQWSGSTFGNLPIGQGLSMTVLQMAAMYQTIANDGVRVPPRIVSARVAPDGTRIAEPKPKPTRVVDPRTARTVRDMLRAVVQDGDGLNNGTGPTAALTGYQISGKTGTGQQIDPATGGYSNDRYWITFAGILPADDPRFVVGIMLDRPNYSGGPPEGRSAAPLFHDIASYLAQRYNIPLSKRPSPVVPLVADQ
jgi:cell division protein FtsI (penicillin-binding protein 3)